MRRWNSKYRHFKMVFHKLGPKQIRVLIYRTFDELPCASVNRNSITEAKFGAHRIIESMIFEEKEVLRVMIRDIEKCQSR